MFVLMEKVLIVEQVTAGHCVFMTKTKEVDNACPFRTDLSTLPQLSTLSFHFQAITSTWKPIWQGKLVGCVSACTSENHFPYGKTAFCRDSQYGRI